MYSVYVTEGLQDTQNKPKTSLIGIEEFDLMHRKNRDSLWRTALPE